MPTITKISLDAEEYKRELAAVVERSRTAAAQISAAGGNSTSGATVSVDATQVHAAAEQTAVLAASIDSVNAATATITVNASEVETAAVQVAELAKLDGTDVNISVNVDDGDLQNTAATLGDVAKTAKSVPEKTVIGKLGDDLRSAWKNLTDFQGGFKKLAGSIGAAGGAVGIIAAGIASVGKIVSWVADQFRKAKEESAQLLQSNARSIRETAERNAALRQETDGYMSKLGQLASAEKLSNVQKAEALQLISDLSKGYGDLGIRVDSATGKITGFDKAMKEKSRRDREQRLAELKAEEAQLRASYKNWGEIGDSAGIPTGFGNWRIGGGNVAVMRR